MTPLELWKDIERLVESHRLDRERVAANAHGALSSLANLRRAAHEIRLRTEHFRAVTRLGQTPAERDTEDRAHELTWAKRRVVRGNP